MKSLPVTKLPPGAVLIAVSAVAAIWGMLAVTTVAPAVTGVLHTSCILLTAAVTGWLASLPSFRQWRKGAPALGTVTLIILFIVALFGVERNGMRGWFDLGICYVQPSEIGKPFFALAVSLLFLSPAKRERQCGLLLTGAFFAAVAMEPDFGTLSIYAAGAFFAAYLAGAALKHLLTAFLITAAGAALYVWTARYAVLRIYEYFTAEALAESPWHWRQMQIAAARGGWIGTGSERAWWSSDFLPLAYNDSLYSVIAEGAGIYGAALVSVLWILWCVGTYRMARLAPGREESTVIAVLGGMIAFQTGLHIAANTGLLPITGINLPFMSYGGSSMVSCGIMLGLMFAASKGSRSADNA